MTPVLNRLLTKARTALSEAPSKVRVALLEAPARVRATFWRLLLNDKVRPFIWLYYIPLWLWGLCGSFFGWPTSYVRPVMGHAAYDLWIWTCLAATTVVMIGLRLEDENKGRDHSRETSWRDKLAYIGIGWQAGGHAGMFAVLLALQLSAVHEIPWGSGATVIIFVISPYVVGCLLLTAQAMTQLFATEAVKKYLDQSVELA